MSFTTWRMPSGMCSYNVIVADPFCPIDRTVRMLCPKVPALVFVVWDRAVACPACAMWRNDDIFRICVAGHCASNSNRSIFNAGRMR